MADADYENNAKKWCLAHSPDRGLCACTKSQGHAGAHVAHNFFEGTAVFSWHDGDTVSVKAGQAAPKCGHASPVMTSMGGYLCNKTRGHVGQHAGAWGSAWADDGSVVMWPPMSAPSVLPPPTGWNPPSKEKSPVAAPAQPSRRELAADLLPRVLELGSAFRGDRMLLMKWEEVIRMLKKEAKP